MLNFWAFCKNVTNVETCTASYLSDVVTVWVFRKGGGQLLPPDYSIRHWRCLLPHYFDFSCSIVLPWYERQEQEFTDSCCCFRQAWALYLWRLLLDVICACQPQLAAHTCQTQQQEPVHCCRCHAHRGKNSWMREINQFHHPHNGSIASYCIQAAAAPAWIF